MFICYGDHFIENRTVQDIRDESDADSWNLVIPHRAARKDGSVCGLHADDSDTRSLLFKNLAHTRDGSARANGRHKRIDFALCILPDLHGRRASMNLRVSGISELIEDDGTGEFVRDLLSLRNGVDHETSGSEHNFRS